MKIMLNHIFKNSKSVYAHACTYFLNKCIYWDWNSLYLPNVYHQTIIFLIATCIFIITLEMDTHMKKKNFFNFAPFIRQEVVGLWEGISVSQGRWSSAVTSVIWVVSWLWVSTGTSLRLYTSVFSGVGFWSAMDGDFLNQTETTGNNS